jgi:hypothetical protein
VTILNADVTTNPATTSGTPPAGELLMIGGSGTFTGAGDGHVYFTIASVSKDTGLLDAVLAFKDGTITVQGLSTAATGDTEHYAITGGTGKYRGARGEVTLSGEKLTSDGETFDLDIALTH